MVAGAGGELEGMWSNGKVEVEGRVFLLLTDDGVNF